MIVTMIVEDNLLLVPSLVLYDWCCTIGVHLSLEDRRFCYWWFVVESFRRFCFTYFWFGTCIVIQRFFTQWTASFFSISAQRVESY